MLGYEMDILYIFSTEETPLNYEMGRRALACTVVVRRSFITATVLFY